ncbi:hypothetical protein D3C81_1911870 [compost metagenome]
MALTDNRALRQELITAQCHLLKNGRLQSTVQKGARHIALRTFPGELDAQVHGFKLAYRPGCFILRRFK